jgi:hypothetical protein
MGSLPNAVAVYGLPDQDNHSTDGNRREQWMTPQAGQCGMTSRTTGQPLEMSTHLQAQVHVEENWLTPKTQNANVPCVHGDGGPDLQTRGKEAGKLNPRWVETLMGLPIGWCNPQAAPMSLGSWETAWFRHVRQLLSHYSM